MHWQQRLSNVTIIWVCQCLKAFFWGIFCPPTHPIRVRWYKRLHLDLLVCFFALLSRGEDPRLRSSYERTIYSLVYSFEPYLSSENHKLAREVESYSCINSISSKCTYCFRFQYPMYIVNLISSKATFGLALQYPLYSMKFCRVEVLQSKQSTSEFEVSQIDRLTQPILAKHHFEKSKQLCLRRIRQNGR